MLPASIKDRNMSKKTEALLDTLYGKGIEKISVIHAAFGETPHVVAMVEVDESLDYTDKLEKAFMLTNSISDAWWKNEGVTPMFPDASCRSTSVGDMVLIGKTKYKCDSMGWSKI